MDKIEKLPKRNEVPLELTWDLQKVFLTEDVFEKNINDIKKQADNYKKLQGTLNKSASNLLIAVKELLAINRNLEKVYVYANMKNDQDTTNIHYQDVFARVQKLLSIVAKATSWFQPELLQIKPQKLAKYYEIELKLNEYQHLLEKLTAKREHTLSEREEALLAGATDIFSASENFFGILNNTDLKFPLVKDETQQVVELSDGVYSRLLESVDRNVRKEAFEKLYGVYGQFKHTFAAILANQVRVHNFEANVRNYNSAREAALVSNEIPVVVYEKLIEEVEEHLPLLHRYVNLRKKVLNIDKVHMYDLYTPIVGKTGLKYTYPEAKKEALNALAILGTEYSEQVREAFNERWIDVVENKGKRSGAYSSGMYDTAPYILLNWQDNLDNLFTLVHEMGHSMHSYLTTHTQPYQYGDYSIFLAEIASTTNENLLTQYLLNKETSKQTRIFILNHYLDGFKGTVFRQTQFAQFEQWIHEEDAKGNSLTADYLAEYYKKLNKHYYGPNIENDDEIALEWTRIPHFYYNFYVYQYATGFAAASTLAKNILSGDAVKIEAYLNFLKSGSSAYPIEIIKKAGIDMTDSWYLKEAFKIFEMRLNELEKLLESEE